MSTVTFTRDSEPPCEAAAVGPLCPGARLGRYELIRPIGRGGMGDVWLARQNGEYGFRRLVAMKTIRAEHACKPTFRRMFLNEAHLAAAIRHTNVVEVLDLAEDNGVMFQVMPLVEGATLKELKEATRLTADVVARIGTHVARGLHAAHTAVDERGHAIGLVHRDVSPQNVLCGVDGFAKISDFGIARTLRAVTIPAGKRKYMAPEQLAGHDVDARSDVFALGVVLREITRDRALTRVLRCATAAEPCRRFATAADFADAIEDAVVLASAKTLGELASALSSHRAA